MEEEVEEVEEAEGAEEGVTGTLAVLPNLAENTSVSMTLKVLINHRKQSRHGAVCCGSEYQ